MARASRKVRGNRKAATAVGEVSSSLGKEKGDMVGKEVRRAEKARKEKEKHRGTRISTAPPGARHGQHHTGRVQGRAQPMDANGIIKGLRAKVPGALMCLTSSCRKIRRRC